MVCEGQGCAAVDGDAGVLEDNGPLVGVVDAQPGVGDVVRVPLARHRLAEVDHGIVGDDQGPVGAVRWDVDGMDRHGTAKSE